MVEDVSIFANIPAPETGLMRSKRTIIPAPNMCPNDMPGIASQCARVTNGGAGIGNQHTYPMGGAVENLLITV